MKRFGYILILFITFNIPDHANSSTLKPPCRIDIEDAHLAMSGVGNKGVLSVKVKFSTVCEKPQSNVKIFLEIWKEGLWGFNHRVKAFPPVSFDYIPANKIQEVKDLSIPCKDWKPTKYYGVVYGVARIAGNIEYTRYGISKHSARLNCGT